MTPDSPPIGIDGIEWRSAKWASGDTSTSRAMSAEDTWERVHPLLANYGITRVANITGLDVIGIPVFNAFKPLGRSLSSGSGKGTTAMAARVGAAMEAIEHVVWEAQPFGDLLASEDDLVADNRSFVSAQRVVRHRSNLMAPQRPLHWTPGWDIIGQCEVLVPSQAVAIPFSYRDVWGGAVSSSNGLASGNTVLEATMSGLLELIERDAVSYHTAQTSTIDPTSLSDPLARELLDRLSVAGLRTIITNYTADTEVPTYNVTLFDQEDLHMGASGGYGTSLDSNVAIVRALTEAAQVHTVVVAGARDDVYDFDRRAGALVSSRRRSAPPAAEPPTDEYVPSNESTPSFEGDLHALVRKLEAIGIDQVIVIRHSHTDDPVQVVRVIVPGLWANLHAGPETFPHFRHGGGRR